MKHPILKSDKFKKARGGYSRLLDISCAKCGTHICYYQKDGPGILKRMYFDRIYGSKKYSGLPNTPLKTVPQLTCLGCKQVVGVPYTYAKENRLAFRLFVGAVAKKIVSSNESNFSSVRERSIVIA